MKVYFLLFCLTTIIPVIHAQNHIASGEQPQLAADSKGIVRLVFGKDDKIFCATSRDHGIKFSSPELIGEVVGMQLGMTRGPQLASSRDYSIVTAMDKNGNIHAFRLDHKKNGKWDAIGNVNDIQRSAPEGLMAITADADNTFYAVWLDLRKDRKNNISFSILNGKDAKWNSNIFAYESPEDHVCECCKPSIAVRDNQVVLMFRNWLSGSRDLYLVTSNDRGRTFSQAQKLGIGTWKLNGCPMDGGGVSINAQNKIQTAWQRDGQVYSAEASKPEVNIAKGRRVGVHGNLISWEDGTALFVRKPNGDFIPVGNGVGLSVYEFADKSIVAVWEADGVIVTKRL